MPDQGEEGGCKEILSGHLTRTFFPVTLDMIDANLEYVTQSTNRQEYEGYDIEFMHANHTVETAIYKIYVGGKQIVFCPDNELNPRDDDADTDFYNRLREFFRDVDVLIHDGQYDLESYKDRQGWGHSAWEEVVDFASQAAVKNLFITHHDPDSDDEKLQALDHQLQKQHGDQFKTIQLAREGEKISF
jgi:phosphoribosyl 1,2-cyclic phosphodiesterase